MKRIVRMVSRMRITKDMRGQDLIEYALIAGFIAVAAGLVMPKISSSIKNIFNAIGGKLDSNATQIT